MDRREFLETSTVLAGGALLGGVTAASPAAEPAQAGRPANPAMMGIQVGAVSFVDEGTDRVLENLQSMAAINTLFVATFTYGRGIAGRQLARTTAARSRQAGVRHGDVSRRQLRDTASAGTTAAQASRPSGRRIIRDTTCSRMSCRKRIAAG